MFLLEAQNNTKFTVLLHFHWGNPGKHTPPYLYQAGGDPSYYRDRSGGFEQSADRNNNWIYEYLGCSAHYHDFSNVKTGIYTPGVGGPADGGPFMGLFEDDDFFDDKTLLTRGSSL